MGNNIGTITDLDTIYSMMDDLKRVNRHSLSNIFLTDENIKRRIAAGQVYYSYIPGQHFCLWHKEWRFTRFYFYIADFDDFQIPVDNETIVCDLFFQKENEKSAFLQEYMSNKGFSNYAVYHKWIRSNAVNKNEYKGHEICITEKRGKAFYKTLCDSFDIYTDLIPEEGDAEKYFEDKKCFSFVDERDGNLMGGLVVTPLGRIQTEEFVFVHPLYQGKGVAGKLHEYWYSQSFEETNQYAAWIKDGNIASEELHTKYGYRKQNVFKNTLLKEV